MQHWLSYNIKVLISLGVELLIVLSQAKAQLMQIRLWYLDIYLIYRSDLLFQTITQLIAH